MMSYDTECVFCKIIEKKIPSATIYEDPYVISFLDINPRFKGHVLVVPKVHVSTLDQLGDEAIAHLFVVVKHIAKNLVENLGAAGYNIMINNGRVAGQVVPHLHVHIIPRYKDEKQGMGFEVAFPVDEKAKSMLNDIAEKVKLTKEIKPIFRSEEKKEQKGHEEEEREGNSEKSGKSSSLPYESEYFNDDGTPKFK